MAMTDDPRGREDEKEPADRERQTDDIRKPGAGPVPRTSGDTRRT